MHTNSFLKKIKTHRGILYKMVNQYIFQWPTNIYKKKDIQNCTAANIKVDIALVNCRHGQSNYGSNRQMGKSLVGVDFTESNIQRYCKDCDVV